MKTAKELIAEIYEKGCKEREALREARKMSKVGDFKGAKETYNTLMSRK